MLNTKTLFYQSDLLNAVTIEEKVCVFSQSKTKYQKLRLDHQKQG